MSERRRGHNEGSIYQRKSDGKYIAQVTAGVTEQGKPKRVYAYCDTRDEAKRELVRLLHNQQQGLNIDPDKMTVAEFMKMWLADVVEPKVRPATYSAYELAVRRYIVPRIGRLLLQKLQPLDVQRMMRAIAPGLAPKTQTMVYGTLRTALNVAERWDLVTRNVATRIDPPRLAPQERRYLSGEQLSRLLDSLPPDDTYRWLYTVTVTLGLRRGEVLGLRWADVDFKAGVVQIRQQVRRQTGQGLQFADPKTRTSRRTVPLPAVAVRALHAQKAAQLDDKWLVGEEKWRGGELVFTNRYGSALEPGGVGKRFIRDCARAGLPDGLTFHALRHTTATFLQEQGVAPRVVMEIMGHTKIDQTIDYTHVPDELKVEAAERMDKMLGG